MHAVLPTTQVESLRLPVQPVNYPFLLGYNADSWEVRLGRKPEDDRIVPLLVTYSIAPGMHGILDSLRGNYGGMLHAIGPLLARTGTVALPWDGGPDEPWNRTDAGPGGYLHVDDVVEPEAKATGQSSVGKHYYCAWDEMISGSNATAHRADRFDAFLAYWQSKGLIPALPPRSTVLVKLSELTARVARVMEHEAGKPSTTRSARLQRELAAWTAMEERTALIDVPAPAVARLTGTDGPARRRSAPAKDAPTGADGFDE